MQQYRVRWDFFGTEYWQPEEPFTRIARLLDQLPLDAALMPRRACKSSSAFAAAAEALSLRAYLLSSCVLRAYSCAV